MRPYNECVSDSLAIKHRPSSSERLIERQARLTFELEEVNRALEILGKNPEIELVLDAVQKAY